MVDWIRINLKGNSTIYSPCITKCFSYQFMLTLPREFIYSPWWAMPLDPPYSDLRDVITRSFFPSPYGFIYNIQRRKKIHIWILCDYFVIHKVEGGRIQLEDTNLSSMWCAQLSQNTIKTQFHTLMNWTFMISTTSGDEPVDLRILHIQSDETFKWRVR